MAKKATKETGRRKDILIDDAKLIFRNFKGEAKQYNAAGQRNVCVVLDQELADQLTADGWNIKVWQPNDPEEAPVLFLKVNVTFRNRDGTRKTNPPKVVLINSKGKRVLDESSIDIVDWAYIGRADIMISPYHYDYNGKQGISAYLQSLFVTIVEDELDLRYSDVPDLDIGTGATAGSGYIQEGAAGDYGPFEE